MSVKNLHMLDSGVAQGSILGPGNVISNYGLIQTTVKLNSKYGLRYKWNSKYGHVDFKLRFVV